MTLKDYYLILGVPREVGDAGIREVFRELAKRYHPDYAGPEAVPVFRDIVEAYEVLSDPEKRRQHNREMGAFDVPVQRAAQLRRGGEGFEAEPLGPEPMSVPRDFATLSTSPEELTDRLRGNFTRVGVPKGERLETLTVEVRLSLHEAECGTSVPIGIPVFRACPVCGGSGRDWLFPCLSCDAQGLVEEQQVVELRIPPGVADRSVFEMPLHGLGIHNLYLRLYIRLDPWP